ncbi:MAG: hypothetical protein A3C35_02010 [Omnitrophica bacterium RIFCSPHIGHO2_02_FULL_46_11]|nr:MAG: hypothetical protein A3C35_02010 [Omnitrophica bacterium RIFCSPHIGHO2_02_FULL_46_11]OGW87453.1 MAG: hypothetical protein A3A81_05775 [Omnitrophica bacterium RIFCSPLOWO2_01_FULL_45_10b]
MRDEIVKDSHFKEITDVKTDSKNRVTLSKVKSAKARIYKVYINAVGQIILDPQATIPAHEQWLFKNKTARDMVLRGLDDARNMRLTGADEDYSKYVDEV